MLWPSLEHMNHTPIIAEATKITRIHRNVVAHPKVRSAKSQVINARMNGKNRAIALKATNQIPVIIPNAIRLAYNVFICQVP